MNKALLVIGLPASGKTTYCIDFVKQNSDFVFLDEPKSEAEIASNKFNNLIIASPFFCIKKNREQIKSVLEKYDFQVEMIFFEKNKEKALINNSKRNKLINMDYWFNAYELNEDSNIIKINI